MNANIIEYCKRLNRNYSNVAHVTDRGDLKESKDTGSASMRHTQSDTFGTRDSWRCPELPLTKPLLLSGDGLHGLRCLSQQH